MRVVVGGRPKDAFRSLGPMSSRNLRGNDGVGQAVEKSRTGLPSEAGSLDASVEFEVVDTVVEREETLAASVEQSKQARVDSSHVGVEGRGLTLAGEERQLGREWEISKTRLRSDARQDSTREARSRAYVGVRTPTELWEAKPSDPREGLECGVLGEVNQEAARLESKCRGYSRAAISRVLAGHVRRGGDVTSGVLHTVEELAYGPGQIIPIGEVSRVEREEVSVEGEVVRLFDPSHPAIAQVGLLDDGSGRCKFTVWEKSAKPRVRAGERLRVRGGALSFYEGQASLAVTGSTTLRFPNQDAPW